MNMTLLNYCWNLICFSLISVSGQFWSAIPCYHFVLILVLAQAIISRTFVSKWTVGIVLAILSLTIHGKHYNSKVSAMFQAGENITIKGRIDSFFKQNSHGSEYTFTVLSVNDIHTGIFLRPKVRLLVPAGEPLNYGELWSFNVKMKPVYGRLNEAGFDQERYFASQGLTGKAIALDGVLIAGARSYRNYLHNYLSGLNESLNNIALLKALSFGDRNDIQPELWRQLKSSGLTHLIAISGLHVGIAYFIGWNLGRVGSVALGLIRVNALYLPLLCGLGLALCYSWLAGFSITTQRAFIMCLVLSVLYILRLKYGHWVKLLVTLSIILLYDPFASMSSGFWLSFSAVAILFALASHPSTTNLTQLKKLIVIQLALIIIMIPVSALSFGGFSIYSPLYNLWAVPYFSFVIVPGIFLSLIATALYPALAELAWVVVDKLLEPVMWSLDFSGSGWVVVPEYYIWPVFILVFMWFFSAFLNLRHGLILITATAFGLIPFRDSESWRVDVLDVGQGLAVLIEKKGQHMLYDTGNRWESGSVAESIIAPILYNRGVRQLDTLILSHMDSDHAGGKSFIERAFNPMSMRSSQELSGYQRCVKGEGWQWQGINFEVLWPPKLVKRAYNPHSCVIKVSDLTSSLLLTGDIEKISEYLLIKEGSLESDIMLVPHHGSNTSSSSFFLESASAKIAIASLAKGNRWGMPHQKVYERYQDAGIHWMDTGESGQISIYFDSNGWNIEKMRENQSVTWYRQMLRNGVE
ncbi:DNA internalization-related competence protein ComEC/Rec2 [Vibrio sp. HN007]|uniref:DNA internalization-related competence protein ComEC/Rec2 n=1 Tax=Vibrio iocasae TaxID=3098914 RepID=UPI0035D4672D